MVGRITRRDKQKRDRKGVPTGSETLGSRRKDAEKKKKWSPSKTSVALGRNHPAGRSESKKATDARKTPKHLQETETKKKKKEWPRTPLLRPGRK